MKSLHDFTSSILPSATLEEKLAHLHAQLRSLSPLIIAYSGGVDSAFLLAEAHAVLGSQVLAVIADSPSLPRQSLHDALTLATQIGAAIEVVPTNELANPQYSSNPLNRCYFCKAELFSQLDALCLARNFSAIAYGENADDMQQIRPGRHAAKEFSIVAPLRDALLTKAEIRTLSRKRNLPTADAPAQPCLSSRIPHGTPVTIQALASIERAEAHLRSLGFRVFRVRHLATHDLPARARIQIAPEEMHRIPALLSSIQSGLALAGYSQIDIDPDGYRSAS